MYQEILKLLPVLLFSYAGQVLMKHGANEIGPLTWAAIRSSPLSYLMAILFNGPILLGFLLAGVGALFYLYALSQTDLTVAMPILGALGFTVLPIVGRLFLQETMSLQRVGGIAIIVLGMLIVARS